MLVVCPTPIGNLDDVTQRQRQALSGADIIACEDTRRAGKLLEVLGIDRSQGRPRLWRYDDHTARSQTASLVDEVRQGRQVVLTTDAGTPTISDPGYRLVRACRDEGLEVVALPGPVAAIVALSASGLATDRFYFEGFLPTKNKARRQRLEALQELEATLLLYESPRRIVGTLESAQEALGEDRRVCVGRELTKRHEEYLTGTIAEVRSELAQRESIRGECTICIEGAVSSGEEEADLWSGADELIGALLRQGVRKRTIKDVVDDVFDVTRSEIYDRIEVVASNLDEFDD